jgi:hypothetical protein
MFNVGRSMLDVPSLLEDLSKGSVEGVPTNKH